MVLGLFKRHKKSDNAVDEELSSKTKQKAAVFVDYEHWFYAYNNIYNLRPNVREWYNEICEEYNIKTIKFFGDFSASIIKNELSVLTKITDDIVHTASMKDGVDKDFTDFIMLDAIYREAAKNDCPEVFIIFTGDGHFNLVVNYLKELKKRVLIYGVKKSFSARLRSSASAYVEMPRNSQEYSKYYDMIFTSLSINGKKGKSATYWKTINNVSQYQQISKERIQAALDYLLKNRYINEKDVNYKGKINKILYVDWKKVKQDGIWIHQQ